jgi:hypothetical protein
VEGGGWRRVEGGGWRVDQSERRNYQLAGCKDREERPGREVGEKGGRRREESGEKQDRFERKVKERRII